MELYRTAKRNEPRSSTRPENYERTNSLIDEQTNLCPPSFLENCDIFERKSASGEGSRMGAAGRCYFRSLSQGFQECSFGWLPVFCRERSSCANTAMVLDARYVRLVQLLQE